MNPLTDAGSLTPGADVVAAPAGTGLRPSGPTLLLWEVLPGEPYLSLDVSRLTPGSLLDLGRLGGAHLMTALHLHGGAGCEAVTLLESTSPGAASIELRAPGLLDLYRVGWARRAGALIVHA
ncbi:hypothetical protein [Terracoccus luteus]|uniref:Uncharacterized protein n=1 Tax=Terracoccus luteus TaxID=53356 RepID=A0A495XZ36_9MICO|nr:hypothetical protein [Terracoccus luteus]MBB2988240.1 hypothetical protein [Terracoccus luteus]MCP2173875.1 hypothetical protein [Terracoccus luteus]RKT77986.1 hypothetical protein DFJ68_1420 [Terracoccus luteus]